MTDLKFWREYLAGAPTVLELPRDHGGPGQRSYRGASQAFALSQELTTGLRELSRHAQVTLRTTLTAAFATLLYRYTGQEDLLVGLHVSGRERAPWQRTVGCFANTVVLRADLAGQPSVLELLKRTREASEATCDHDDVPFDAVVHEVQPELSPKLSPARAGAAGLRAHGAGVAGGMGAGTERCPWADLGVRPLPGAGGATRCDERVVRLRQRSVRARDDQADDRALANGARGHGG